MKDKQSKVAESARIEGDTPSGDVNVALAEWLELAETVANPDEVEFLRTHAHLAEELKPHLDNWKKMQGFIGGLRDGVHEPTATKAHRSTAPAGTQAAEASVPFPVLPDYQIEREIGRGGMGVVYKARQVSLDRWVALKVFRGSARHGAQDAQRFQNEAAVVAGLDDPHIVPIFDIGEHAGQAYYAMKLFDRGSLADAIGACQGVANVQAMRRAAQLVAIVARAIHHAHQRGVLHRDLKPSNILLDSSGLPHVADFGLAKRLDDDSDVTRSGELIGTPGYMAPEQASGVKGEITTATDVFGLGGILYAMLTGHAPFRGNSLLHTLELVKECEPAAPTATNAACDRDLETICLKALARDSLRRYGSALELAEDLERWLAGEPILARPTTSGERLVKWIRRRPAAAALIAVSALALGGFLAGLIVHNHHVDKALAESDQLRKDGLERERDLRRHLYVADLRAARQHWDEGEDNLALAVLNRNVPKAGEEDLRGFGWHQLQAACNYRPRILDNKDAAVLCVAVAPDNRWAAAGDKNGGITIYDLAAGKQARILPGPTTEICSVRFSPDSKTFAAAGMERKIRRWDVETWQEKSPLVGFENTVRSIAFSPDGTKLAAAVVDDTVRIWDLARVGTPISLKGHTDDVTGIDWAGPGKHLFSVSRDGKPIIWNVPAEQALATFSRVSESPLLTNALHPTRPLAAAGGYDRWIRVLDISSRSQWTSHSSAGTVRSVAFSPDGRMLAAVGGNGAICLLDLASNWQGHRLRRAFHDGESTIRGIAFADGGASFVTGAEDGAVKWWDVAGFSGVESRPYPGFLAALSRDGKRAVSRAHDGTLTVFDTVTHKLLCVLNKPLNLHTAPVFSDSGKVLAATSPTGTVTFWDLNAVVARKVVVECKSEVLGMALSPTEELFATGDRDGCVRLWNPHSGQLAATLQAGDNKVILDRHFVVFAANGKYLISGYSEKDTEIVIWNIPERKRQHTLTVVANELFSLALSRDGQTLAAGIGRREIRTWDIASGQPCANLIGHGKEVYGLAFSPDGQSLVSTGMDGQVRIWNLPTAQSLYTLHTARLNPIQVAFSGDGQMLTVAATIVSESEILRWNLP